MPPKFLPVALALVILVTGCAQQQRGPTITVGSDSAALAMLGRLTSHRTEMVRLIDTYNRWDPPPTRPGTPFDQIKFRDPPGTSRAFKRLDALSESLSARLQASIDSFPALRDLTVGWYNVAASGESDLHVETGISVAYQYRPGVKMYEDKYVLPPLAAVRADIIDVVSEVAPPLFGQYPQLERLDVAVEVGTVVAARVVMTRAAFDALGDKRALYEKASLGTLSGLPVDPITGHLAFSYGPNEYLIKQHNWK